MALHYQRGVPRSVSKYRIGNIFKEFCESTSLHGYSYLYGKSNSIALKIVWIFIILALTGIGICFVVINTWQYLEARIITTVETFSAPLSVSEIFLMLHLDKTR